MLFLGFGSPGGALEARPGAGEKPRGECAKGTGPPSSEPRQRGSMVRQTGPGRSVAERLPRADGAYQRLAHLDPDREPEPERRSALGDVPELDALRLHLGHVVAVVEDDGDRPGAIRATRRPALARAGELVGRERDGVRLAQREGHLRRLVGGVPRQEAGPELQLVGPGVHDRRLELLDIDHGRHQFPALAPELEAPPVQADLSAGIHRAVCEAQPDRPLEVHGAREVAGDRELEAASRTPVRRRLELQGHAPLFEHEALALRHEAGDRDGEAPHLERSRRPGVEPAGARVERARGDEGGLRRVRARLELDPGRQQERVDEDAERQVVQRDDRALDLVPRAAVVDLGDDDPIRLAHDHQVLQVGRPATPLLVGLVVVDVAPRHDDPERVRRVEEAHPRAVVHALEVDGEARDQHAERDVDEGLEVGEVGVRKVLRRSLVDADVHGLRAEPRVDGEVDPARVRRRAPARVLGRRDRRDRVLALVPVPAREALDLQEAERVRRRHLEPVVQLPGGAALGERRRAETGHQDECQERAPERQPAGVSHRGDPRIQGPRRPATGTRLTPWEYVANPRRGVTDRTRDPEKSLTPRGATEGRRRHLRSPGSDLRARSPTVGRVPTVPG